MDSEKEDSLVDKINKTAILTISGITCISGGFICGWSDARNIPLRYDHLLRYGPSLLSGGMMGANSGIELYDATKNLKEEQKGKKFHPLMLSAAATLSSAANNGFMAAYNTLVFYLLGYTIGKLFPE